ncbi:non-hydrolyzing UDP-N-acetylglucosamine 2-epimerase [Gemmatimonas sp.]
MSRSRWLTPMRGGAPVVQGTPNVAVIVGTRPEVIKMAPVVRALRAATSRLSCTLVSTGQHRDLLARAFEDVGLVPDIELSLMTENQSPSGFVARAISALDDTFAQTKPNAVLVQGDTSSACAGAMAATWRSIPVGHVEAGLRSFNFQEPFPEEFHRRVVGVAAQWHFAPTPESRDNLLREGVPMHRIFMTGNTIVDAVKQMDVSRPYENAALDRVPEGRLALVTAHRRENQGESMRDIARAVKRLVSAVPDLQVVLPLHPNPNVRGLFKKELEGVERVHLLEPLSYPDLLKVLHRSTIILSDSGGLQEEAPSVGRPILILRERTERPEVVQVGAGILVGTDPDLIVKEALAILCDPVVYDRMVTVPNPFGDGKASERIVDILESSLCEEVDSPVMSMVL